MTLRGVIVPVATPLEAAGGPDLKSLRALVRFLLDAGVHGLFANGSMGAFALLTDSQQASVIGTVVEAAERRVPVLAGVSDTGTARVLEKVRRHERLGVDALVSLPPFFFPCSQEELYGFYQDLAEAAAKPVVLYDNPRLARNALSAQTIVRLAVHPNVRGVKLSAADPQQWHELLQSPLPRERFALICGAGRITSLALRLGFDGITEGLHNLIPGLAVRLFDAAAQGDLVAADAIQSQINRCFEVFDIAGGWRGLEVALRELGFASHAAPRPHDRPLDAETRDRIQAVLERENIVAPSRAG
jgi:4-hydroxy-tetrahydrodipicolinate synthase